MERRMISFIEEQRVATICVVDEENKPYCFSCFYAFDTEKELFYFKSSLNTHHGHLLRKQPVIAGTIQPDKLNPLAIKGVQFTGMIVDSTNGLSAEASRFYHQKYPFALAMPGKVWVVQPGFIKMTDATLGFGKKIVWPSKEVPEEV